MNSKGTRKIVIACVTKTLRNCAQTNSQIAAPTRAAIVLSPSAMTAERTLMIASAVPGLVHLIAASHLISWQRGYRWTAGDREREVPPLRGVANRVDQATTDFLETFPIFSALVSVVHVTGRHDSLTLIQAHLYFGRARRVSPRCCRRSQSDALGSGLEYSRDRASYCFIAAVLIR